MLRTRLSARWAAEGESILAAARAKADTVERALTDEGAGQLKLGRAPVEWTRHTSRRSQVDNARVAGDHELLFELHAAGER